MFKILIGVLVAGAASAVAYCASCDACGAACECIKCACGHGCC